MAHLKKILVINFCYRCAALLQQQQLAEHRNTSLIDHLIHNEIKNILEFNKRQLSF